MIFPGAVDKKGKMAFIRSTSSEQERKLNELRSEFYALQWAVTRLDGKSLFSCFPPLPSSSRPPPRSPDNVVCRREIIFISYLNIISIVE